MTNSFRQVIIIIAFKDSRFPSGVMPAESASKQYGYTVLLLTVLLSFDAEDFLVVR